MRILYPTSQGRQFYERNGRVIQQEGIRAAVAPHADFVEAIYSVPVGRRALAMQSMVGYRRITAAAPIGLYGLRVELNINTVWGIIQRLDSFRNVANDLENLSVAWSIMLGPGDGMRIVSSDASTGGTVNYNCSITVFEFDV